MSRIVVLLNAIHMPRVVHIELSLWMCSIPSLSTSNSKSLSLRTVLRSFWCSSHLALRTTWNTLVRQSSEVTPSWDPKVTCLSCARAKLGVLGWNWWIFDFWRWILVVCYLYLKGFDNVNLDCQCVPGRSDLTKNFTWRSLLHNWGWSRQRPLLVPFLYILVSCLRSSTARWRMVGS